MGHSAVLWKQIEGLASGGISGGWLPYRDICSALVIIQQRLLHRTGLLGVEAEQSRVGACPQRRVHNGDQGEQHPRGQCGGRGRVQTLAEAVALVIVRLRHQRRVAQVRAVQREDSRGEQAAVFGLHPQSPRLQCI